MSQKRETYLCEFLERIIFIITWDGCHNVAHMGNDGPEPFLRDSCGLSVAFRQLLGNCAGYFCGQFIGSGEGLCCIRKCTQWDFKHFARDALCSSHE